MPVKKIIKSLFRSIGLDIHKLSTPPPLSKDNRYQWLRELEIATVLDIGANIGQAAKEFSEIFPDAAIISFEPLKECYETLCKLSNTIPKFKAYNLALGDFQGKEVIYRNNYSLSSSILRMELLHETAFPFTSQTTEEIITVEKLDAIAPSLDLKMNLLIKIDVQGFEDKVIMGGIETLKRATVIITEVSFYPLYKGQLLFDGIYDLLKALDFSYKGSYWQLTDPKTGQILQQDAIFIKN
jgi:FkbM family methyltransferase